MLTAAAMQTCLPVGAPVHIRDRRDCHDEGLDWKEQETKTVTIRLASEHDMQAVLNLREEAARWLETIGSDQWQTVWPTLERQNERIRKSIVAGETSMLYSGSSLVGTVAVDEFSDPSLWTPAEQAEPAYYMHRLIIARSYAGQGLGAKILDWCCDKAARSEKEWIRVDVWTSNTRLQNYYLDRKFSHVRTLNTDYPSGALFQRPAEEIADLGLIAC